ncbi:hypothetical protein RQP46_010754 [Phenoliferia psychrophenolica]
MASFSLLPPELLAHIFDLSNSGEPSTGAGRSFRARFSLISRACLYAVPAPTYFFILGEAHAKALAAKLEREQEWVAQEGRRARTARSTRSTFTILRVTNVQHLSLATIYSERAEAVASLLRAIPNLVALNLQADSHELSFAPLVGALGELAGLREFTFKNHSLRPIEILRILIPLKALEVLDLDISVYDCDNDQYTHLIPHLTLPRLNKLQMVLTDDDIPFSDTLLRTLATNSTVGIHKLTLNHTRMDSLGDRLSLSTVPLIPSPQITKIKHFTWTPWAATPEPEARDAVLALVGSMTGLQSIEISTWTLEHDRWAAFPAPRDNEPIDATLFDTLATLPSLHSVTLTAMEGILDELPVVSFIQSHHPLHHLSISFETIAGWTPEQRGRVEEAAHKAGVVFKYEDDQL